MATLNFMKFGCFSSHRKFLRFFIETLCFFAKFAETEICWGLKKKTIFFIIPKEPSSNTKLNSHQPSKLLPRTLRKEDDKETSLTPLESSFKITAEIIFYFVTRRGFQMFSFSSVYNKSQVNSKSNCCTILRKSISAIKIGALI